MRGALRILHVLHSFPPYSRGGTERYVEQLARAQLARGAEVSVLHAVDPALASQAVDSAVLPRTVAGEAAVDAGTSRAAADRGGDAFARIEEARFDGLRVLRVPQAPLHAGRALIDPDLPGRRELLQRCFARERVDVVHVHHWHGLDLRLVSLARAAGSAAVVTLHDYFSSCARFFRVPDDEHPCPPDQTRAHCAACLERDAPGRYELVHTLLGARERVLHAELAGAGARIAVSEAQRRMLAAIPALAGLEFETARFPWAELPGSAAAPAMRAADPARRLSIATWGGLVRGKGLHVLVAACAALPNPARVAVHHYGNVLDRDYADECLAAARGFELVLHGPYVAAELRQLIGAHDLAVFPSLFLETHGYTVDEALLLGLPVLVSARGAAPERIGTRGLVFPAGDSQALSTLLGELLVVPARLAALRTGRHEPPVTLDEHVVALEAVYARALVRRSGAG
jgi:glycosyltransferase involved in cell wall biosynthesis